jgi:hypothetical protein
MGRDLKGLVKNKGGTIIARIIAIGYKQQKLYLIGPLMCALTGSNLARINGTGDMSVDLACQTNSFELIST